jgi:outer membrane protein OmpA-like peptidoglycan-associated protein
MKIILKIFIIIFIAANAYGFVADDIEFTKITDMKLGHEKGFYHIDVVFGVRNLSHKDIQLKNCRFDLFFALKDSENIRIGTSEKAEIILKGNTRSGAEPAEQYLDLSTLVGAEIRKLHLAIISSDEMNALLTNPEPKLGIRIKGSFDGGIRSDMGWTYQRGLKIDWLIQSYVSRKILIGTYKKIEAAADKENGEESDAGDADPSSEEIIAAESDKLTICFAKGQNHLNEIHKNMIRDWIKKLESASDHGILHIEGHTDADGHPKNKALSEKRANLVRDYLFAFPYIAGRFPPDNIKTEELKSL